MFVLTSATIPAGRGYFKGGRGFFVIVLVANQKPRFSVNHMNSLCTVTIRLLLILYTSLLYRRYLRRGTDAFGEDFAMLVLRESRQISKDPESQNICSMKSDPSTFHKRSGSRVSTFSSATVKGYPM